MATDPAFGQPLLAECTAQAELLVNEMLFRLTHGLMRVTSFGDTAPPGGPSNGDAYVVGGGATGAWSGQDGKIAFYLDGWKFMTAAEGHRVWVMDDNWTAFYDGGAWVGAGGGGGGEVTLADAVTINWDTRLGTSAWVMLQGNRTLGIPSNLVAGALYALTIVQDATGSRTLTWPALFKWPGGTPPVLTTTPSAKDTFLFVNRGGDLHNIGQSLDLA